MRIAKGIQVRLVVYLVLILIGISTSMSGCDFLVNWMAFFPDRSDFAYGGRLLPGVEEVTLTAADGVPLQAYVMPHPGAMAVIVYFHGNAGNASHRLDDALNLRDMGVHVVLLSYRGYGRSGGRPSEKGIYLDGEAALEYARERFSLADSQIFLYGRSLGSTVAVHLAADRTLGGLILITPMTSAKDYAVTHGLGWIRWLAGDAFDSLSKVPRMQTPGLMIHGDQDEVLPYTMGRKLFEAYSGPKRWVTISKATHNDLTYVDPEAYWGAVENFITDCLMDRFVQTAG